MLWIKKVYSPVFLDKAQTFDRLWHQGPGHKLNTILPKQFSDIIQPYVIDKYFRIKQDDAYSDVKEIKARFLQSSVLGLVLYILHLQTVNIWQHSSQFHKRHGGFLAFSLHRSTKTEQNCLNTNGNFQWI